MLSLLMAHGNPTEAFQRLRQAGLVQRIPALSAGGGAETSKAEPVLEMVGPVPLPIVVEGREELGRWYVAAPTPANQRNTDGSDHLSVIAFGDPEWPTGAPLVRIHSTCFTGDVLGSLRCDCGPQLRLALREITESPVGGMVVYMAAHEGRGIGLWSKAAAYLLQDEGLDTYEANRTLGFSDDERDFHDAAALVRHLVGDRPFRLLTNNPDKVHQMRAYGLTHVVQQVHVAGVGERNLRYIRAKRRRGHDIPARVCCGE